MPYNKYNKLNQYLKIMDIVKRHYVPGVSTYKGVWKMYVYPIYPMSYNRFIQIVGMPNLRRQMEEEREKWGNKDPTVEEVDPSQLSILDIDGVSE